MSASSSIEPLEKYELLPWLPGESFVKGKPFNLLLVGPSASGKSTCLRDLYMKYWESMFDVVIVFCQTLAEGFFSFVESNETYTEWDGAVILKWVRVQEKLSSQGMRNLRILVIFDDMIGIDIKNDKVLTNIFTLGRHYPYNMSIVYSTQDMIYLAPTWRIQVNFLVMCRQRTTTGIERQFVPFLSGIATEQDLLEARGTSEKNYMVNLSRENTQDHHCFVVDYLAVNNSTSGKDMCFQYLAEEHPRRRRHRHRDELNVEVDEVLVKDTENM